jgi:hypothetical protein
MASIAKELGIKTEILCIDTWLGSVEHVLKREFDNSLRRVVGYPTLYYTFLSNVIANDVQEIITPIPLSSEAAYQVLKRLSVSAELVYIDAGHDYESVKRDLEMYYSLLDEKGVLMGDDYIGWTGVTKAVDEFVRNRKIEFFAATRGKFIISKTKMRPDFNALADEP